MPLVNVRFRVIQTPNTCLLECVTACPRSKKMTASKPSSNYMYLLTACFGALSVGFYFSWSSINYPSPGRAGQGLTSQGHCSPPCCSQCGECSKKLTLPFQSQYSSFDREYAHGCVLRCVAFDYASIIWRDCRINRDPAPQPAICIKRVTCSDWSELNLLTASPLIVGWERVI